MQAGVGTVEGRRKGGSWPRSTLPNGVWRQGPAAANRGAHSCHQVTERTLVGTLQTNVNWRLLQGRCRVSAKQKADHRSVLLKHSHKKMKTSRERKSGEEKPTRAPWGCGLGLQGRVVGGLVDRCSNICCLLRWVCDRLLMNTSLVRSAPAGRTLITVISKIWRNMLV